MRKVSEQELKNVRGGVTAYADCPGCGHTYQGKSLFGYIAYWVAQGKARKCMYSHYDNL